MVLITKSINQNHRLSKFFYKMFRPLYNLIKTPYFFNNLTIKNVASSHKISTIPSVKSNRQEISNRQKFRQINPPPSILKEIEA